MARRVWKFSLRGGEENNFFAEMPADARVISAGWQAREFVVWAVVDPIALPKMRRFHVSGTGHPFPETVPVDRLVSRVEVKHMIFHVFDLGE